MDVLPEAEGVALGERVFPPRRFAPVGVDALEAESIAEFVGLIDEHGVALELRVGGGDALDDPLPVVRATDAVGARDGIAVSVCIGVLGGARVIDAVVDGDAFAVDDMLAVGETRAERDAEGDAVGDRVGADVGVDRIVEYAFVAVTARDGEGPALVEVVREGAALRVADGEADAVRAADTVGVAVSDGFALDGDADEEAVTDADAARRVGDSLALVLTLAEAAGDFDADGLRVDERDASGVAVIDTLEVSLTEVRGEREPVRVGCASVADAADECVTLALADGDFETVDDRESVVVRPTDCDGTPVVGDDVRVAPRGDGEVEPDGETDGDGLGEREDVGDADDERVGGGVRDADGLPVVVIERGGVRDVLGLDVGVVVRRAETDGDGDGVEVRVLPRAIDGDAIAHAVARDDTEADGVIVGLSDALGESLGESVDELLRLALAEVCALREGDEDALAEAEPIRGDADGEPDAGRVALTVVVPRRTLALTELEGVVVVETVPVGLVDALPLTLALMRTGDFVARADMLTERDGRADALPDTLRVVRDVADADGVGFALTVADGDDDAAPLVEPVVEDEREGGGLRDGVAVARTDADADAEPTELRLRAADRESLADAVTVRLAEGVFVAAGERVGVVVRGAERDDVGVAVVERVERGGDAEDDVDAVGVLVVAADADGVALTLGERLGRTLRDADVLGEMVLVVVALPVAVFVEVGVRVGRDEAVAVGVGRADALGGGERVGVSVAVAVLLLDVDAVLVREADAERVVSAAILTPALGPASSARATSASSRMGMGSFSARAAGCRKSLLNVICSRRAASHPCSLAMSCLQPGATPITLPPTPLNIPYCALGFYCPFLARADGNISTWPAICAPTAACQLQRLGGTFCGAQGTTEPETCAPGFYCPTPLERYVCPAGSYCPRGSTAPRACAALSVCETGTRVPRFWGGLFAFLIIDLALVAAFLYYKNLREPAKNRAAAVSRRRALVRAARALRGEADGGSTPLSPLASSPTAPSPRASGLDDAASTNPLLARIVAASVAPPSSAPADVSAAVVRSSARGVLDWDDAGSSANAPPPPAATASQRRGACGSFFDALRLRTAALPAGVVISGSGKVRTRSFYGAAALGTTSAVAAADVSVSGSSVSGEFDSESVTEADLATAAAAAAILQDAFRRVNAGQTLTVSFSGLSLTLPPPVSKCILESVSGEVAPGRVTAIMGPSGAGKTTFLNVLMGRLSRTAGGLYVNGVPDEMARFGRITGFVPQEDVMLTELTVRENIAHSASVRLPRAWPRPDVELLVDAVIEVLGLAGCADTPVANISGGQRKRTNIGIELVTAPSALFLDEPTSGLDATAALRVCDTLRSIADLGLTVVAVVHQPRAEIFRSVSDLLLLAPGGKTVFMGEQRDIEPYFLRAGVSFADAGNVADDLLDYVAGRHSIVIDARELERIVAAASGGGSAKVGNGDKSGGVAGGITLLVDALRRHAATRPLAGAALVTLRGGEVPAYLAARWRADGGGSSAASAPKLPADAAAARATLLSVMDARGASLASQFALCHGRSLIQQYRTPSWLALELGVCCFAGAIMGLAATAVDELYAGVLTPPYTALSPAPLESLLPSLGLYQNMALGVAGAPAAVRIFGEERDVFVRENRAGHSAGAYFCAKNVAVSYRMALAALHFAALFCVLARPTSPFATLLIMHVGILWGVYGLAQVTSMAVGRANAALLGTILALIVACLCGFGPSLVQGREWGVLILAQDASYSRWANELWLDSETSLFRSLYLVEAVTAKAFGYDLSRAAFDVGMMAAIGAVLRVAAFSGLLAIARWAPKA